MRVLLADDDTSIQKLARITLERVGGHETHICGSGAEALRAVSMFRPDIVILDVNMPDMDGIQTLAEIRRLPGMSRVPVVFLTASTEQHEIDSYTRLGASGVIAKPFDAMTFPGKIGEVLAHREKAREEAAANLQALTEVYAAELPAKVREIEALWQRMPEEGEGAQAKEMLLLVHKLAGSGATFGFPEVSAAAHLLELALKRSPSLQAGEDRRHIEELVRGLAAAAVAPRPDDGAEGEKIACEAPVRNADDDRLIYLVVGDSPALQGLSQQLGYFGYRVCSLRADELREEVARRAPAAIIADMSLRADGLPIAEIISGMAGRTGKAPVIFLSETEDFAARLSAVRAGGEAYFTRSVDTSSLIDKLDALTARSDEDAYRILIVDDDITLASRYDLILKSAGMRTEITSDPLQMMEMLFAFRPDLILMDMYMPDSSGIELSKVIRQMSSFVSIPIVFLSAETDVEKQLAAMSLGGDDFLTKPIKDSHLVSSVRSRVERSRLLHSFMVRDSLTGLLNHTKAKEQLQMGVARAERGNSGLAYALIDIDHFKAVNDTYGHATGDQVLKGLSRLLLQRLRKTDVVGRYGGEEFSVLLEGADSAAAKAILDTIREDFFRICHQCRGQEFYVSFSCGIATFPEYRTAADLHEAADAALYRAKREGRNRICLAG